MLSPAFTPVRKLFRLFSFFCTATVLRTAFLVLLRFMMFLFFAGSVNDFSTVT